MHIYQTVSTAVDRAMHVVHKPCPVRIHLVKVNFLVSMLYGCTETGLIDGDDFISLQGERRGISIAGKP